MRETDGTDHLLSPFQPLAMRLCDLLQLLVLVIGITAFIINRQADTLWTMVAVQLILLIYFRLIAK
jgi:hypothetical protein